MCEILSESKIKRCVAHPAVEVLPFLGLPHPAGVGGEDAGERCEHGLRLRAARVLREEAVHDGGALHYQSAHILREREGGEGRERERDKRENIMKERVSD